MAVSDQDGAATAGVEARGGEDALGVLLATPEVFDWRQAVRVAEDCGHAAGWKAPGFDCPPGGESPRLAASVDLDHAYADVGVVVALPDGRMELLLSPTGASARLTMLGAHGAMPQWYSELALERAERGDGTLVDFLAMFEHRLLSLSYRGWWHHRLEVRREQAGAGENIPDLDCWLDAAAGLGDGGQRRRVCGSVRWLIRRFVPLFANVARSAWGLAALAGAYAGVPVRVEEMAPRWLPLPMADRNRLPDESRPAGINCRLGDGLVLGEAVREAQTNFNLVLGPMSWDDFSRFLPAPAGADFEGLCELVGLYAGPDRSFGVRLEIRAGETRGLQLGGEGRRACLGWNVWLVSGVADGETRDAFFALE